MTRFLLAGMVVLLGLVAIGRFRRDDSPLAAHPVSLPVAAPRHLAAIPDGVIDTRPSEKSRTPASDLLARLETKRRLVQAAPYTYFDSLLVDTDSVLRRWTDERPLLVAVRPEPNLPNPLLDELVRHAVDVWGATRLGIRLIITSDTAAAQLVVRAVDRLDNGRAGQTDLSWSSGGAIRSAAIFLARVDSGGKPYATPTALAVAVHEFGHALGLPHSGNPADAMYPMSGSGQLSLRDRATIELLYELPLGSLREAPHKLTP